MIKGKLMSLLIRMDVQEKKDFERWYFYELKGRKTHPWNLFQLVKKGNKEYPSFEALGEALEKRSSATASKIRDYASNLCGKMELFLAIEVFKKDDYQQKVYLLHHYQQTSNTKAFEKTHAQEVKEIEKRSPLDADDYEKLLQLSELNYNHAPSAGKLQKVNELFDLEWTLRKLELACINLSYQNIHGFSTDSFILSQIIEQLPKWPAGEASFWHRIYWEIFTLFTKSQQADVHKILNLMNKNIGDKKRSNMKNAYSLVLNYQIGLLNADGSQNSRQDLLTIYKWGLKYEFLLYEGKLNWLIYKNLVTLSLQLGQHTLGLEYLESLKQFLDKKEVEEAYRYCKGAYFYYIGQFHNAIKLWSQQRFNEFFYEIHARFLGWQNMYEFQLDRHSNPLETERLFKEADKLESFIQKQQNISKKKQTIYLNRVSIYKGLFEVKTRQELDQLEGKTVSMKHLNNKKWLLSMIELRKQDFS